MNRPEDTWNTLYDMATNDFFSDKEIREFIKAQGRIDFQKEDQALEDYIEISQALARYLLTERTKVHGH